jgi:hypothetical protein
MSAAAVMLLGSCALGPDARVIVELPPLPEHWARAFPELSFLIVYPDAAGMERRALTESGARSAVIWCSKAGNTPVLAFPQTARDSGTGDGRRGLLRPAGALYPMSLDDGEQRLNLCWEDGPVASIIARLRSLGRDASLVGAARLAKYLRQEPDPWELDLDGMAEKLARGSFSAYDIDPLPGRAVMVTTGPGEWFFESPFAALLLIEAGTALHVPRLSQGMHYLFSVNGALLKICVGAQGVTVGARE